MVDTAPFRGLLYNRERAGDISGLVSPPYDVISEKKRIELLSCSPYNIVNLILPEGEGNKKYQAASSMLEEWLEEEILIYDDNPCFYGLRINFRMADKIKSLSGFIGLTRIEDYESGKVLRHEKTLSAPKEDRYRLLESCSTNFGLIYTIYRDESQVVSGILNKNFRQEPFISTSPCYSSDLGFDLWKISDAKDIDDIRSAMLERSILIADGHHRYETSLMYSNRHSVKGGPAGPSDYVLTLFMESSQEELKIYPTHRRLSFKMQIDLEKAESLFSGEYIVRTVDIRNSSAIISMLKEFKNDGSVGFVLYAGQKGAISLLRKSPSKYQDLQSPDVYILHGELIDKLDHVFGLKDITFDHDGGQVKEDVDNGKYDLGIFLNPPTVKDMEDICYSGGLMPQKSTFFQPKPCTGLVMYRIKK